MALYILIFNGSKVKGLTSAKHESAPLLTDLQLYKSTLAVFGLSIAHLQEI